MPRPRKQTERWSHPLYRMGFCLNRKGTVYTEIGGVRTTTGLTWHEKNRKAALQILEKRVLAVLNPPEKETREVRSMTIGDALKEYARIQFPNVEKDTRRVIKNSFDAYLPSMEILLNDTDKVRDEVFSRMESSTYHINTQRKYLGWLRRFFAFCVDEGYCETNPVKKSMIPKEIAPDRAPFTQEEYERIEAYFSNLPNRVEYVLLLRFLRLSAVRISEALKIVRKDVTADYLLIHGKGRRDRKIPFAPFPKFQALVQEIQNSHSAAKLFSWNSYAGLELALRKGLSELGIEGNGRSFHSIRKLRENEMIIQERLPVDVVCQILGHTRSVQEAHYLRLMSVSEMTEIIGKLS
jgi:integrase